MIIYITLTVQDLNYKYSKISKYKKKIVYFIFKITFMLQSLLFKNLHWTIKNINCDN